jgi:aspartyl/asparaginyl beta-hydroxylase (cupin superfamily)
MPNFHDVSGYESTRILESNYERIKEEILNFYDKNEDSFKPNFTPYKYKEEGWRTINMYAFMMEYPDVINQFPVINEVVKQIPHMVTAQVAVLKPHTRVKAHFGDSNVIVRNHLGIVIPGKYPELGFRNGSQERCWEEGKVLSICIAHRHYVWNNTDHKRIILLVDTIHPDYVDKKYYVCGGLLAAAMLKVIATKFPRTRKAPKLVVLGFHKLLTIGFMINLFVQNKLGINISHMWSRFKVEL